MNGIAILGVLCAMFCACFAQPRLNSTILTRPVLPAPQPGIPVPWPCGSSWAQWGRWSSCSVTCGTGVQTRRRFCQRSTRPCDFATPERTADVADGPVSRILPYGCIGSSVQTRRCVAPPCVSRCHVHGGWSSWGCWGACINEKRQRHRVCNRPIPQGSGNYCSGSHTMVQSCKDCAASQDIVFVIDTSGSIGEANFDLMVSQVDSLINTFDLDTSLTGPPEKVRVGILLFNHGQILKKHLNQFTVPSTPYHYSSGGTNIAGAINYARTKMFVAHRGDRAANPNTLVLITDGWSANAVSAANAAKSAGITVIAVGVGSNVQSSHINSLVTAPASTNAYTTNQFCAIGQFLRKRFDCPQLQSRSATCSIFTAFRAPGVAQGPQNDDKLKQDYGNY